MANSIHIQAPAKLNLGLLIAGKRTDGFHDLLSVFHAVDWCDTVSAEIGPEGISLECSDPELPCGPGNLVWDAASLFVETFGIKEGVHLSLEKTIPYGAGLGGGSSDAAATLHALQRLFGVSASDDTWLGLCAQLGSDVPFFHASGTARVEGRGEIVTQISNSDDVVFLVAVPPVHVLTPWAYKQITPPYPNIRQYRERINRLESGGISLKNFCLEIENTFQPVVEEAHSAVRELREAMASHGALCSYMSGSGSSVFGVFENSDAAERILPLLPCNTAARVVHSYNSTAVTG